MPSHSFFCSCMQWGEDADVKIRDLDMGEMGGEDI